MINECIRFARLVGYRKITLWTATALVASALAGFAHPLTEKRHPITESLQWGPGCIPQLCVVVQHGLDAFRAPALVV